MSSRAPRIPSYRLHKPSGQAVVTLNGVDRYLGRHGSPESRSEYERVLSEWLANGRRMPAPARATAVEPAPLTVSEMELRYHDFAREYYRKGGNPTDEPDNIALALKPLTRLYGLKPARDFGPLALKAVRQAMLDSGTLCRAEINKRVGKIVRAFKWAAENELVPAAVYQALRTVAGLKKGRCTARESDPVLPVREDLIDAVRPHVSRQVWAMIELQRLTGMRPGEVTQMRTRDLDLSGKAWVYTPASHKTEHHARARRIFLGPRAQEVLRPWLRTDLGAFLFSPLEAMEELWAARRSTRQTPLRPSQRARKKKMRPAKTPGHCYTVDSYRRAIQCGSDAAFPHPTLSKLRRAAQTAEQRAELKAWRAQHRWHPHQLRHNAATRLRKDFGLDVARVILGHSSPAVTAMYAEADFNRAAAVMVEVG